MPQPDDNSKQLRTRGFLRGEYLGLLGALLVLILFFGLQSEYFWSSLTFTTLANQIPSLTVIAVGMTFVLIIAGIDLSVGSVMALSGSVLGLAIMDMNAPLWLAGILCRMTGLACGRGTVPVYGINYKDKPADARRWLDRLGDPYARIGADLDGRAGIEWGVYGLPETFVVDTRGRIVYKHIGPVRPEDVATTILPLIKSLRP